MSANIQTILVPSPVSTGQRPSLNAGDHLSRAEFERRYAAYPEIKKAELVEGVVFMPSPIRAQKHAQPHADIIAWLGAFRAATPGVVSYDNATVRLDFENEVQPDVLLRLEPAYGGKSRVTADDYLEGAPELVIEIAASSVAYDLHEKKRVYQRTGVLEYLALQVEEQKADWFVLREGVYEALRLDEQGILRSEAFPGLWLQPAAFWKDELAEMLRVLQEGLATPEHSAFAARLKVS
ncbi:MAG: Uma2 family endonuclease [Chloroflexi bacterium]|nr:Uma2 family endonuclease [Chloroflexota bacterium]